MGPSGAAGAACLRATTDYSTGATGAAKALGLGTMTGGYCDWGYCAKVLLGLLCWGSLGHFLETAVVQASKETDWCRNLGRRGARIL